MHSVALLPQHQTPIEFRLEAEFLDMNLQHHVSLVLSGCGGVTANQMQILVGTAKGVERAHKVLLSKRDAFVATKWIF